MIILMKKLHNSYYILEQKLLIILMGRTYLNQLQLITYSAKRNMLLNCPVVYLSKCMEDMEQGIYGFSIEILLWDMNFMG